MGNDVDDNAQHYYSIIHSLNVGFFIVLYTGSHSGLANILIYRNGTFRLIVEHKMITTWRKTMQHSGARSRAYIAGNITKQAENILPSRASIALSSTADGKTELNIR